MVYFMVWKIWHMQLDCTPHYGVFYGLENMVHAIRLYTTLWCMLWSGKYGTCNQIVHHIMVNFMVWKIWYMQLDCTPHYGEFCGLENMVHAIRLYITLWCILWSGKYGTCN